MNPTPAAKQLPEATRQRIEECLRADSPSAAKMSTSDWQSLLRELQRQLLDLERANDQLRATCNRDAWLAETRRELSQVDLSQEVLAKLWRRVRSAIEVQYCWLRTFDAHGQLGLHSYYREDGARLADDEVQVVEQAISDDVARHGHALFIPAVAQSGDRRAALLDSLGITAYLCHPCDAGDAQLGTLSMASVRRGGFTTAEAAFMSGVAEILTAALHRTRDHATIRASEERLWSVLSTAADAIINIDYQGTMTAVNPATEKIFGYSRDELLGRNVKMLMPLPYCDQHDEYVTRYLRTGETRIIGVGRETQAKRKDGEVFPIGLAISHAKHLRMFTGIIRDMSAIREMQEQVLNAATETDLRIGQELHDNIQQQLTGLGLLSRSLADRLGMRDMSEASMAERLASNIGEVTKQVHMLSHGLIPGEVGTGELRQSLEALNTMINQQYGMACTFEWRGPADVLDGGAATHLYRITQEAVNNAFKHANCDRLHIRVSSDEDSLTLQISDNGIGIDHAADSGYGQGVRLMRYRASLLGGRVELLPSEQGGTQVRCHVLLR